MGKYFKMKYLNINDKPEQLKGISEKLSNIERRLLRIADDFDTRDGSMDIIARTIRNHGNKILSISEKVTDQALALEDARLLYHKAEEECFAQFQETILLDTLREWVGSNPGISALAKIIQETMVSVGTVLSLSETQTILTMLENADGTLRKYSNGEISAYSKELSRTYQTIYGLPLMKETSGVKIAELGGKFDFGSEDGKNYINGSVYADLFDLEKKYEMGMGSLALASKLGSANLDVTASKTGIDVKADVEVADVEINGQYGTDKNNVHASAEGKLLAANAEFEGKADLQHLEIKGKGSAYVAAAEVEAKQGFTIFGITVDAEETGAVGAIGGEVECGVSPQGISFGEKLALGAGEGLKINIHWN